MWAIPESFCGFGTVTVSELGMTYSSRKPPLEGDVEDCFLLFVFRFKGKLKVMQPFWVPFGGPPVSIFGRQVCWGGAALTSAQPMAHNFLPKL